ncbi:MAG: putative metal-dependent hydrolase [Chitinophagaceae bacterium]
MQTVPEEWIYPVGRFTAPETLDLTAFEDAIREIKVLPRILDACVENLDEAQLRMPYRDGGWNIQQIIHHLADSHMNAYIRCKLALTENDPVIKPYDQDLWAETNDVLLVPHNYSITMLHALHHRWAVLLASLSPEQRVLRFYHPESEEYVAIWEVALKYAWHGRHHAMQIRSFRSRMEWL